jgi:hypothetical protein
MSLSFPLDLLADFPGTSIRFEAVPMLEIDPTRSGRIISKDLGPALWEADYQSKRLLPNALKFWKAKLLALQGQSFIGYDMTACFPIAYPNGSWPTGGSFDGIATLASVTDAKVLTMDDLPAGYVGSVGDYVSFDYGDDSRALHQVMESFVADGSGVTGSFEVRPHVRPGYNLLLTGGLPVALTKPRAVMVLVPGSVIASSDLSGRGSISFTGRQTL